MKEAKTETASPVDALVMPEHDAPKCEKCESRTALITGNFYYEPDYEPYNSGVEEDAKIEGGEAWVVGWKCDSCRHIQNLWHE